MEFNSFVIFGGCGFVGTHVQSLLKEKYPDEVRIIAEPENNDGCIYCELPTEWFSIRPPVKKNLTAEQRQKLADRLRLARENSSV